MRFSRYIAAIGCVLALISQARACEFSDNSLALRDLVYAGDIDGVENTLKSHQESYERGALDVAEMRCMMYHFARSRPETMEFIHAWLRRHPESVFAATAKATSLFKHSWNIRGDKPAQRTHPDALAMFRQMQDEAWQHAERAFNTRPRFVRAAEILIENANGAGQRHMGLSVFANIARTDPNSGSYSRALNLLRQNWGWSWDDVVSFCKTYAPEFEEVKDDPVRDCQLRATPSFPDKYDWRIQTLAGLQRPDLDHLRLHYLTREEASAEDAAAAYAVLSQEDWLDVQYADAFDSHLAVKYDLPMVETIILNRRRAFAESRLEHDPYNVNFLEWLRIPAMETRIDAQGNVSVHINKRLSPEETLVHDMRILTMKPFDADAWMHMHAAVMRAKPETPIAKSFPLFVNAIYYGRHQPQYLRAYMGHLITVYSVLEMAQSNAPVDLRDAENREAFETMMAGLEPGSDVLCPFMRARRVLEHVCSGQQKSSCEDTPEASRAFAFMEAEVKAKGVCWKERLTPAQMLYFTPLPMPDL